MHTYVYAKRNGFKSIPLLLGRPKLRIMYANIASDVFFFAAPYPVSEKIQLAIIIAAEPPVDPYVSRCEIDRIDVMIPFKVVAFICISGILAL